MKFTPFLIVAALMYGAQLRAQTGPPQSVAVSLTQSSIKTTTYPFDVPFTLTGNIPDNCIRINFNYTLTDKRQDKSWVVFKGGSSSWTKSSSETSFSLRCDGLHPNMDYQFDFDVIKNIVIDDNTKKDLNQKLATRIIKFADDFDNGANPFKPIDVTELNGDLITIINRKILSNPLQKLVLRSDATSTTLLSFDVTNLLGLEIGQLRANHSTIAAITNNLDDNIAACFAEFKRINDPTFPNQLLKEVSFVLSTPIPLNDDGKQLLDVNLAPSIDGFGSYTLRSGLILLKRICQSPIHFSNILDGSEKINNNQIVSADGRDIGSIEFLNALFDFLTNGLLVTTQAPPAKLFVQLGQLPALLSNTTDEIDQLVDAKASTATIVTGFPDLTQDLVIDESVQSNAITITDVSSQNTPYISLDGGVGYCTTFQSAYSFYGVNFYLAPVNKQAHFRDLKGWNKVKKLVSINLGIINLFSTRPAHTYSILGDGSNTDLSVGIGIRPTNILKINISCLPYRIGTNPITNDRQVRLGFNIGLGLDVGVLGAFATVAKALSINL